MKILALAFLLGALLSGAEPVRPHVVFVTGDDEYRSEFSMPMLARILEAKHGVRTSIAYARPTPQSNANIEGLEALKTAALAVFFLRWRRLPDEQLQFILGYLATGKPLAGFRTSTHSFQYPPPRMSIRRPGSQRIRFCAAWRANSVRRPGSTWSIRCTGTLSHC